MDINILDGETASVILTIADALSTASKKRLIARVSSVDDCAAVRFIELSDMPHEDECFLFIIREMSFDSMGNGLIEADVSIKEAVVRLNTQIVFKNWRPLMKSITDLLESSVS